MKTDRSTLFRNARKSFAPLSSEELLQSRKQEAEGGCGVVGLMSSVPVAGRHLHVPSMQMQNRGNGKGGGMAAVGLLPEEMGVSEETLERDYILQVAYLDPASRADI